MQVTSDSNLAIPASLRRQLLAYRSRVWQVKILEAVAAALIGLLVGFLLTYVLDRVFDTPPLLRAAILAATVVSFMAVPVALQRWVLRRRRLDQLARLLVETRPGTGDQLLGIIELSQDGSEKSRSPELVEAAIRQVSEHVGKQDLSTAVPDPRHKQRAIAAGGLAAVAFLLLLLTTPAATNAWNRFLAPWQATPRFTFASIEPLPERLVVPHGEDFDLSVRLQPTTHWKPSTAKGGLGASLPQSVALAGDAYPFHFPGQIAPSVLDVRVGDYRTDLPVEPMLRPELHSLRAEIVLPAYLERKETLRQEVRGATLTVVKGSAATLTATASRPLAVATINGKPSLPEDKTFSTEPVEIAQPLEIELAWEDEFGLAGKQPFQLTVSAVEDQPPTIVCEGLSRERFLLDTEVLSFGVRAHDDFGVKRVGIEWQGLDETLAERASGERLIGAGSSEADQLELAATFCASDLKIQPQSIALRVFVEDYLPGRPRVYSPAREFEILDAEQHAVWISSELSRWHRMSLDVRDREMQLHETNKQLRSMPDAERNQPENLEKIAEQAERESENGRRLKGLVQDGEGLLKEAMRNPEIGVGHLDQWAEMMQVLKEISENRMPSVAKLLKQASQGQVASAKNEKNRSAGQNRLTQNAEGKPKEPEDSPDTRSAPSINDIESSHHDLKTAAKPEEDSKSPPKQPRLTLPGTKLAGTGQSESSPTESEDFVEEAVDEQQDLLAEFDKVVDELNSVLANLEGSTLVKRLKASSRRQQQVASKLASLVSNSFGVSERQKDLDGATFRDLAETEAASSQEASHIMDDMAAYYQRSRFALFGRVLEDMREQDVTAGLRQLGDELRKESGLSISQAEYWSDNFDRWAEDLVEVTKSGACPGSKAKGSLPPSIVLEVLKLLEGEMDLREQTRVAEQARPAVSDTTHVETAESLSETQNSFYQRMNGVIDRIGELPDAEADFAKELGLLNQVSGVMAETTEILAKPDTGPPAIAAETEIIELLLQSKRFNPNAGGGGGSDPGGGGGGDTETPALALVGAGTNEKEVREELSATQATGSAADGLPDEYRSGLDEYFSRLESWKSK